MAKVDITTAGHTITVEADEDLDTVAAKALELWTATRDERITHGFGTAGFVNERSGADGTYTSGYDHQ